jgi:hypothetical protein
MAWLMIRFGFGVVEVVESTVARYRRAVLPTANWRRQLGTLDFSQSLGQISSVRMIEELWCGMEHMSIDVRPEGGPFLDDSPRYLDSSPDRIVGVGQEDDDG